MQVRILAGVGALGLLALGVVVVLQASRIAQLEAKVGALDERLDDAPRDDGDEDDEPWVPARRDAAQAVRAPGTSAAAATSASAEHPTAVPAAPVVPAVRVPVSQDETSRVESAVLNLLDGDHPELRAKLREVVQEQQQSLEQEQREQRRERWISRREATLVELGNEVGLSTEQREQLMGIMLATRDQMTDMRQGVDSPEAFAAAREKVRALREQSEAQVKALLKPEQYEAYRARFSDDDDERRRRPERPARPEQ